MYLTSPRGHHALPHPTPALHKHETLRHTVPLHRNATLLQRRSNLPYPSSFPDPAADRSVMSLPRYIYLTYLISRPYGLICLPCSLSGSFTRSLRLTPCQVLLHFRPWRSNTCSSTLRCKSKHGYQASRHGSRTSAVIKQLGD